MLVGTQEKLLPYGGGGQGGSLPLPTQAQSQSHTGKEIWEHGNPATEEAECSPKREFDRQVRG